TPTLVTESEAATAEKTDLVIWCGATDLPSVGDVFAGERDTPSPAGPFIAALDRQSQLRNTPNVVLVRTSDNPWSAQLSGAVRAVAREWPKSICKNIVTAGFSADRLADAVLLDLVSDDRTIDVRWTAEGRAVMGLEIVTAIESATIGAGDTVLITGGTRGIGLNMGVRLAAAGAKVILVGRSAPSGDNATVVAEHNLTAVQADVTDRAALAAAITDVGPIHAVVHCAGILADGPLGEVDASAGARARSVKIDGWLNALSVAGGSLKVALGIGSWAGRFGNRHQTHYAAANAQLAALANHAPPGVRAIVAEFGPWSESEMVRTIPAAIQAAMRAEGIDFVTDEAGLDALMADLNGGSGIAVHGRTLPSTTRRRVSKLTLSVNTHPFLTDHAIEGVPVLPLAGAADLVAQIAGLAHPFEVADLRVFGGVAVREALHVEVSVNGERAEIRTGDRRSLAYQARVRPASNVPERAPLAGGDALPLSIADFYKDVTFHGPLLAGVRTLDGVGPDFARGTVATASPAEWEPATQRAAFSVDPLALDSAFQLSAMVAWERYHRAGTPVSMGRYVQISPMPTGTLQVDVHFGESNSDRFSADFWFRDDQGNVVAIVQDAVAELKQLASDEPAMELKAEWTDAGLWPEVKDLEMRLEAAGVMGIRNPFFTVHEGTARNITQVDGKELINFSSYNYLGLSGDPRVLADVHAAVDKYGTSVSASRVASGERPFHQELEALLAKSQGCEDSLVFTAGHATNVTTIGHLFGPGDLILHDEFIHDSALQGIKLSGAGRRSFKHDDPVALEALLKDLRPHQEKVLIIVEGVYSMDGDICNLPAYVALKKKYGCMLMVDEAHSFGVIGETGCGLAEYYGIQGNEVDLWMGTLSKSLASCGGWIAASKRLINYLRYTAPGFVFSAGITAANAQAALSSLKLMLAESDRVIKLQHNSKLFHDELVRQGVDTGPAKGGSAVVPAITGNSFHALMLSQRLVDQGINVQPIVYPAVADDAARLRFFLSSTHTDDQLIHVAERGAKTLVEVRVEFAI
ncbi:MAG: aminotransferase class I/II-fold pyridoxal phosphate-dependent enzyme, partial [Rhodobacterales bacterium]|nr:aminotransferase class I/II-fold pyridoxal phosphate-dependent enzyme [Rhodobacterales bacterium]